MVLTELDRIGYENIFEHQMKSYGRDKREFLRTIQEELIEMTTLYNVVSKHSGRDIRFFKEFRKELFQEIKLRGEACKKTTEFIIYDVCCDHSIDNIASIAMEYLITYCGTIEEIEDILSELAPSILISIEDIIGISSQKTINKLQCKYDDLQDELTKSYSQNMTIIQNQERKLRDDVL